MLQKYFDKNILKEGDSDSREPKELYRVETIVNQRG